MRVRLMIVNLLMVNGTCQLDADFIHDYFVYKKAQKVVGYTCNSIEDNIGLVTSFAKAGIPSYFGKSYDESLIRRLIGTNYYKLGIYVDIGCENSNTSAIFSIASQEKLYDDLHHWLIGLPKNLDGSTDFIDDRTFTLATDFVMALPSHTEHNHYKMYDVYTPHKARSEKLNITFLGTWNRTVGLSVFLTQEKYARRANLYGMYWKVYFVGSKYRPKNVSMEKYFEDYGKTGTKDGLSKFGYIVVKHLAELYNATLLLGEFTKWKKNDRIGPISRALIYETIDMGGTPVTMFSEKLSMVKIAYTTWPFRTCFMFLTPPRTDITVEEVLRPLQDNVWHLFSVMMIFFMGILMSTLRYEDINNLLERFTTSVIIIIGCISQQGTNQKMNQVSTRIVFLSIMIFSFLIYNYYSASIVSARLNVPIMKINDSLNSLAMTSLQVASEPMLYFDFFMQENPKETSLFNQSKWQKVPENDRFIPPDKGMLLVKNRGWAYHTHPEVGYPYINRLYDNREICELTEVHLAKPNYRSIVVGYNSSFVEISKRGFTRLTEVGLRQRQLQRWTSRKPLCRKDILSASSTTIYEFTPHLVVLSIGMTFSIVLCSIEIAVYIYNSKNRFQDEKKLKLEDNSDHSLKNCFKNVNLINLKNI